MNTTALTNGDVVVDGDWGPLLHWTLFHNKVCNFNSNVKICVLNCINISSTVNIGCRVKNGWVLGISFQKRRPVGKFRWLKNLRKLGVDLQYRKSSAKPWLTNITDGLILQWNQVRQRGIATMGHTLSTERVLQPPGPRVLCWLIL